MSVQSWQRIPAAPLLRLWTAGVLSPSFVSINANEHIAMNAVELSWDDWRAVIAVLRAKALPYMLEHADHIERLLEQHGPSESIFRLGLTD